MKELLNKKLLIFFSLVIGIGLIIDYSLFKNNELNFQIKNKTYETPNIPRAEFKDINFYKCIIDSYNSDNRYMSDFLPLNYNDYITDEQLSKIRNIDCDENLISYNYAGEVLFSSFRSNMYNELPRNFSINYLNAVKMYDLQIHDVTGIELMPNLTSINFVYDDFETINLNSLNKLKRIAITYNKKITSIDLSNMNDLTEFKFSEDRNLEKVYLINDKNYDNVMFYNNKNKIIDLHNITYNHFIKFSNNLDYKEIVNLNKFECNQVSFDDVLVRLLNENEYPTSACDLYNYILEQKKGSITLSTNSDYYIWKQNDEKEYIDFNYVIKTQTMGIEELGYYYQENFEMDYFDKEYYNLKSWNNIIVNVDEENKLLNVSYSDDLTVSYPIVSIYTQNYDDNIYYYNFGSSHDIIGITGDINDIKNGIQCLNCNIGKDEEGKNIVVKYNDQPIKQYKYFYIDSSLDLTKGILIVNNKNRYEFEENFDYNGYLFKIIRDDKEVFKLEANDKLLFQVPYENIDSDKNIWFDLLFIESDKYNINYSDSYIYTGLDLSNEISSNINLSGVENITSDIENNKYIIKHNDDIIKEFNLINISSTKYDLTKDYVFDIGEDILSNINVLNGDKIINNNKIQIKKDEEILQEFKLINATSSKYDLSSNIIKIQDNDIESLISNIDCTNCRIKVKNNDTYKTSGDFTDGDILVITSNNNVLKEYELSYAVSGVSLNNNDLTLNLDKKKTFKIEATVLPSNAENKNITWESSDPNIVSVDENGNVTAHSIGNAIITVKTEEREFTAECNVSVIEVSTYTVTYPDNSTGEYEENGRITFKTDLTRQGYKLVGYRYDNKDYNLTDELLMPAHDIELEAIWELVIPNATNNNKYVIEDNYFKKISLNTDINDLDLGLDSIYTVKITKNNIEKTSGLIGTGDIINIYLDETLVTNYTVIIKGDVTGSGDVKVADVAKLYQYLKKKIKMDECYIKAGNVVDSDNEIKVADVAKLYQYLKKKIKKL